MAGGLVVERSADEAVASVFSLSSAAPHLFGDRRGAFERDLRGLLRETSATGRSSERTRDIRLELRRPSPSSRARPGGSVHPRQPVVPSAQRRGRATWNPVPVGLTWTKA
ncbi:hypothetical protein BBK14_15555 [Parafrankia soli]|uniref:Uncharacterized protein n=1 Tax=Parafrankia soli TaxID=2599596 RepID=A0A1S1QN34_9ACTN|nr:hypothetical protein BBK14_15555 [Parafrankia soli]